MSECNLAISVHNKFYDVLEKYIKVHGSEGIAENFIINVSEWHGVAKKFLKKHPGIFNVFEYDDSNLKDCSLSEKEIARLAKTPHCPSVLKDGTHRKNLDGTLVTCDRCQRCYRKTGERTAVYAH